MSSVWTGMACEAGREEREPKVRDPSPLDVHGSNLEGGRKEDRQEEVKKELSHVMFAAGVEEEKKATHHSCATEGMTRARYSVSRRSRVLNTDVVESGRCLGRRERVWCCT